MNNKDLSILQPYCENDMKKLKRMSRSIFMRFNEPLTNADYDDFYSIANITLWQAYNSYDPDKDVSFEGFLYSCLEKKFKSELTNRHRHKRIINQFTVSLEYIQQMKVKKNPVYWITYHLIFVHLMRQPRDRKRKIFQIRFNNIFPDYQKGKWIF